MFRPQGAIVWFPFFFLVWNADIVVMKLSVSVKEWDELISKNDVGESLDVLDRYCANVVNVVKELEPKLNSVTLSCDMHPLQKPNNIHAETINVQLAVLKSEMEKVYSSEKWFPSLKNALESGTVNVDSTWITKIVSVSETHLFNEYFGTHLVADRCADLKNIMSRRYSGFGELMENCLFDMHKGTISMSMKYQELMKKGYCCFKHNIYRRIYWSVDELLRPKKYDHSFSNLINTTTIIS
ncbi:unnamed protein product [Schistosoma guineensis]|nr:unnamed protein product [Schistosoma guineensis]